MSSKTTTPKTKRSIKTKEAQLSKERRLVIACLGMFIGFILIIFSIVDLALSLTPALPLYNGIIMPLTCDGVNKEHIGCGLAALMLYGCMFVNGIILTVANGIWIRIIKTSS